MNECSLLFEEIFQKTAENQNQYQIGDPNWTEKWFENVKIEYVDVHGSNEKNGTEMKGKFK